MVEVGLDAVGVHPGSSCMGARAEKAQGVHA